MQYMCYDLKELEQGQVIEVELKAAANVKLMDAPNYEQYTKGRLNRYVGGRVTRTPYRVLVPHAGHWYCVVEGGAKHELRVLPGSVVSSNKSVDPPEPTLPPAPPARPKGGMPAQPAAANHPGIRDTRYDVFICHAIEDQEDAVKTLVEILAQNGIKAGYVGFDINTGDNLSDVIKKGLAQSKIGVVVISRYMVKKGWTGRALDRLLATYQRSLIPVWHHITAEEVLDYNASVARRAAMIASRRTIYDVAEEIRDRLRRN